MLVTLKEILKEADNRNIAIGAFNAHCLEAVEAEIRAAQELELPVIIQFAQCHEPWIPLSTIGPVMIGMAKAATVPVCVHLDHGETLEYLEQALKIGFTGIMYDGSALSYEDNLSNTVKAVKMAAEYGASVEAELGSMGKRESGDGDEGAGADDDTKIYTDPDLASSFVKASGIDALACSFGTTHGIYLKEPRLDLGIVRSVREKCGGIPVVMHGGSGVSADDFRQAIEAGVRKINYFTYMDKAGGEAAARLASEKDRVFFSDIYMAARNAMYENVKEAMKVFGNIR
ncbi:MAG: class II fructose-bisphosphate aldolase [Lachnospiraceae bacterium]|nr:class II fructose-bisphosphate aldolase [Lachnospiraceae bacterium]